jgi:hypothetical protein
MTQRHAFAPAPGAAGRLMLCCLDLLRLHDPPLLPLLLSIEYLEDPNQPEAFEPHHAFRLPDLNFTDGTQPLAVGVDAAITLQARQPNPAERVVLKTKSLPNLANTCSRTSRSSFCRAL